MTDELKEEIGAMQRELSEMRTRLDQLAQAGPEGDGWFSPQERQLSDEMARRGKSAGIGVWRLVITQNQQGRGVSAMDNIHTDKLGFDEQRVLDRIRAYSDPMALRAMHRLISRHLEGSNMSMSRKELAADLGVDETALEAALLPLFEREVVRRTLSPGGEEIYEVGRTDEFLLLL